MTNATFLAHLTRSQEWPETESPGLIQMDLWIQPSSQALESTPIFWMRQFSRTARWLSLAPLQKRTVWRVTASQDQMLVEFWTRTSTQEAPQITISILCLSIRTGEY